MASFAKPFFGDNCCPCAKAQRGPWAFACGRNMSVERGEHTINGRFSLAPESMVVAQRLWCPHVLRGRMPQQTERVFFAIMLFQCRQPKSLRRLRYVATSSMPFLVTMLLGTLLHMHFRTPQETEWFEFKRVIVQSKAEMTPVGNLCLLHGLVTAAWPRLTPEEVVLKCQTSPKFAIEFAHAEKMQNTILKTSGAPHFKAKTVYGCDRLGLRVETRLALLTAAQFAEQYNKPLDKVPGVRVFTNIRDEEGNFPTFLAVPLHGLPEKYCSRTVTLFSESMTAISEEAVSPALQIRVDQAGDHYGYCMSEAVKARPPSLRLDQTQKLLTHDAILGKVKELDEKLVDENEDDIFGDFSDAEIAEAAARRRGLTIGTGGRSAVESSDLLKAKQKARAKAKSGFAKRCTGGGLLGAPHTSGMSSRTSTRGTPTKSGSTSLLRMSMDCSGSKSNATRLVCGGASSSGELSIRIVYPSLNIDQILSTGAKLNRSKRGVGDLDDGVGAVSTFHMSRCGVAKTHLRRTGETRDCDTDDCANVKAGTCLKGDPHSSGLCLRAASREVRPWGGWVPRSGRACCMLMGV